MLRLIVLYKIEFDRVPDPFVLGNGRLGLQHARRDGGDIR